MNSGQNDTKTSTKRRKSQQIGKQNSTQTSIILRPGTNDRKEWKVYWKAQDQPWRTEPEIDGERQNFLAQRRATNPDIEQGTYPFKNIKLKRADVEWLLATHENGRGPINWSDVSQRGRKGLDLRGADLRQVNLQYLPLARLQGGLDELESVEATKEQRKMAAVIMKCANLQGAHLEGAILRKAALEEAFLVTAHLERADLLGAHLESANLKQANLNGASLQFAFFDEGTYMPDISLGNEKSGFILLSDARWRDVNLAVVKWSQLKILGEEDKARQKKYNGKVKDRVIRLEEFEQAVRANRQLANILQNQGLNEQAARFVYRAQKLQRVVYLHQRKFGKYLFSGFLDLLAGYGYKPWRSFLAYLLVISVFTAAYFLLGQTVRPSLSPLEAFVFSMTSFHGRGFFPGGIKLDNPLTVLAAIEAFVGLLIEVTFIATLTQRLFGK